MALKEILIHLDSRPSCSARLALAAHLARSHGARLTGLHIVHHPYFGPRRDSASVAAEIRRLFEAELESAGIEGECLCLDWPVSGVSAAEIVNLHAYYRDLVIVGQPEPDVEDRAAPADLAEKVVLGAGRPVLVVPYAGTFETFGERVMVAWRGGPESSRALADALPLLGAAREVRVVEVSVSDEGDEGTPRGGDVCVHLGRHGVVASCETVVARHLSIGDLLLNNAAEAGTDLLVMGAYAQTRRGGLSLGEVGRHLLRFMTVPVLMSH